MDVDTIISDVWKFYRDNFNMFSLGITLALLLGFLVAFLGYLLAGVDIIVTMMAVTFIIAGIYVTVRSVLLGVDGSEAIRMSRFILAEALFTLIVLGSLLVPDPIAMAVFLVLVIGLFFYPVLAAELGIVNGFKKVLELIRRNPVSYPALSVLLMFLYYIFALIVEGIAGITVRTVVYFVFLLLVLYVYIPIYVLTPLLLLRSEQETG